MGSGTCAYNSCHSHPTVSVEAENYLALKQQELNLQNLPFLWALYSCTVSHYNKIDIKLLQLMGCSHSPLLSTQTAHCSHLHCAGQTSWDARLNLLIWRGSKLLINMKRVFCWVTRLIGFITWLYKSSDAAQRAGRNLYLEMMRKAENTLHTAACRHAKLGLALNHIFTLLYLNELRPFMCSLESSFSLVSAWSVFVFQAFTLVFAPA